jgi:NADH:ubiquinone oxidoreductase subunit 6 (subunit J)
MSVGYIGYVACLFLFSGAMLLLTDVKKYAGKSMIREMKTAKALGWISLVLACAAFVGYWMFRQV